MGKISKPSTILKRARAILESNSWGRYAMKQVFPGGRIAYCMLGAVEAVRLDSTDEVKRYLYDACGMSAWQYNDGLARRKQDVLRKFDKAIKLAEAAGR